MQEGFSSSDYQAVLGVTQVSTMKVYQQCWKEWAGWCVKEGVPNNAISACKLAEFLGHPFRIGLAWLKIGIYYSAFSAFLGPHHHNKTSIHPVIS